MLTDLEVEPQKDITAMVLKYTLMGVVSTDHDEITIVNTLHPDLKPSDHFLLHTIRQGGITKADAEQFFDILFSSDPRSTDIKIILGVILLSVVFFSFPLIAAAKYFVQTRHTKEFYPRLFKLILCR